MTSSRLPSLSFFILQDFDYNPGLLAVELSEIIPLEIFKDMAIQVLIAPVRFCLEFSYEVKLCRCGQCEHFGIILMHGQRGPALKDVYDLFRFRFGELPC